jgi:spermidine synthase
MAIVLLLFGLGALSVVAQTILVRELLVVVHGTELALGLLFAVWLFWIGVGATLGMRMKAHRWLWAWAAGGSLLPIVEVIAVRSVPLTPFLAPSIGQTFWLCLIILAPFCLVIGITFPIACRVLQHQSGRAIARLYISEAAGAVFGGALFSFLLVGRLDHLTILTVAAAGVIAVCAALHRRSLLGVAALVLAAAWPMSRLDDATRLAQLHAMMPGQRIEKVVETPYQQVVLARIEGQITVYGDGLPIATVPDPYETSAVAYGLLAQVPRPDKVLLLGSTTTELAAILERAGARVTVVQPDARLVGALGAKGVTIADVRSFVRGTADQYDLVLVDAPDPTAAHINRLYTVEFFRAARRVLTPRGVLCLRLTAAAAYVGREVSDLTVSVRQALRAALPNVVVTPGETIWLFASATRESLTDDRDVVRGRMANLVGAEPYRADIVLSYEAERLRRLDEMTAVASGAITNSDHHPSSYHYASVLWDRTSSATPARPSILTRAVSALRRVHAVHVAAGVCVLLALAFVTRRRTARAVHLGIAIAASGFVAMMLDFVLLIEYQSACGALYQDLAIMSALFMAGVVAGAGPWAPKLTAATALAVTAVLALLIGPITQRMESWPLLAQQTIYGVLFVAGGVCLGLAVTACANALMSGASASTGRAGGLMDATDHLGAAVGALLTGTLVLPAVGAGAALAFAATLAASVGLVLYVGQHFGRWARLRP